VILTEEPRKRYPTLKPLGTIQLGREKSGKREKNTLLDMPLGIHVIGMGMIHHHSDSIILAGK